ncbi:MAG: protein translocase subunit SecD [Candidatus Magasanikbacteria bacterium CG10_big_fil_rev_8_21_14_0_10_47_10]|uniref:Protein translocase subunit SecD n=1 Tax=Candidatus Magasanikbacteria bacterium CG10_big_fil_rev_8_21_14_0_10_47_10 TaxID=1974652 RepID=A0A2H0TRT8_9BACT|nr:MAG: protein translocase subunit SecD [Candidatus Magasanikbacteria bacterium CG10_big_fil_rev_8_21_14_0_10_47_10]
MAKKQINLRSKLRWGIVGVFALLILSVGFILPSAFNRAISFVERTTAVSIPHISEKSFKLGLDLQGGAHLIYKANVANIPQIDRASAVDGVRDVIERRINGLGVSEPNIQTARVGEEYRLNIELPGIEDVNQAIALIGDTPILEFREQNTEPPRELTEEEVQMMNERNAVALERANEALEKVKDGAQFDDLVKEYSEDSDTNNNNGYIGFLGPNTVLGEPLYRWAATHNSGDISDTLIESEVAHHIVRRGGQQDGVPLIDASHILVCYLGARNCPNPMYTKEEAAARAQELYDEANADNFAALARDNSDDQLSASEGGSFSPFPAGSGPYPELDSAIINTEDGQIIGPVETPYGYHVVYKQGTTVPTEYEVSHIAVAKVREVDILPPQDPWKPTELGGKQLDRAEVVTDSRTGNVQVSLQFDSEGTDLFEEITKRNVGQPVAIFLDGQPISVPTVQQVISGGNAVITGTFSVPEARELAQRLNTGALPVPIDLISEQSVGATLGAESLQKSLKAGLAGIILVMIFMMLYYRLPGILSVISLSVYISVSLAIFKLIGVTLSLAGIAGFILSIGMAVDANVLIFERLKEELREGKSMKASVEEGFIRAWSSIRDGNLSTLITCFLLIWFGSSFVQGFAATLAIGILVSMFSAITITRVLLRFVIPWFGHYGNALFLGAKKTNDSDV